MEMITAVLAGDRSLELRLFGLYDVTPFEERQLTNRLCKLMDRSAIIYRQLYRKHYLVF